MAKIKDLRAKTDDELNEQIIALKKESMKGWLQKGVLSL